jgi:hypothetical protein
MSGSLAVILADKINAMATLLGLMRLTTDKTKKPISIMYFGVHSNIKILHIDILTTNPRHRHYISQNFFGT